MTERIGGEEARGGIMIQPCAHVNHIAFRAISPPAAGFMQAHTLPEPLLYCFASRPVITFLY
ncbi:MAG: hypothetical protein NZM04_08070 [Methylacidiphilales bacterium]|nr:hypothetical protein [Candidatus Methylacidiphilales bacterium]